MNQPLGKPNQQLRSAVRGFYAWIGSMIILALAPLAAMQLVDNPSPYVRAGAVILGVGGGLPWGWVVFSIIRRGDEFMRRLHLVSLALAFAGTLVLLATLDWSVRVGFIGRPAPITVMGGAMILWLIALFGTKIYFERER